MSSFGVELELLVAVRLETEQYPPQEDSGVAQGGQPVIIPQPMCTYYGVEQHAYVHIENTINRHVVNSATRVATNDSTIVEGTTQWDVKPDSSLRLPDNYRFMEQYRGHHWVCLEITSPALWASPESFQEVKRICEALITEYVTLISPSCGMHIHWGLGFSWVPVHQLRRLAALFLASDPLLAQLHPASRKQNRFCLSNRFYSAVAQGTLTAEEAGDSSDRAAPEATHARPVGTPHIFSRQIAVGSLEGYPLRHGQAPVHPLDPNTNLRVPQTIPHAARELLSCSRPEAVGMLMDSSPEVYRRLAYNFKNYTPGTYLKSFEKSTLEFRQGPGTLNGDEVVAFSKVYVGLCEFACQVEDNDLWPLILRCADSDMGITNWDVFDFLIEVGLSQEAQALQQIVLERRHRDCKRDDT